MTDHDMRAAYARFLLEFEAWHFARQVQAEADAESNSETEMRAALQRSFDRRG